MKLRMVVYTIAVTLLATASPGHCAESAPLATTSAQKTFPTPEAASRALADAVRGADRAALLAVLGPQSEHWLFSGDIVTDRADWNQFLVAYDQKNTIVREGDAKAFLGAGSDDWLFPAPLVKRGSTWAFDPEAGREETARRRIGRNELDTIQTLLAVVDAQREYAATDADRNGSNDYARKFISSAGKKDGLYWPVKTGEAQSPLGPLVGAAASEGYGKKTNSLVPYHGYYYRLLTVQGKDAPGSAYDYVVNGKLIGGFSILAYPAKYEVSGVMTFKVNHDGVVYEKDLGADTATQAVKLTQYNPDKTWKKTAVK